ncbi:hypothetical protein JCM10212_004412 [Sporobolomyces blumeae]
MPRDRSLGLDVAYPARRSQVSSHPSPEQSVSSASYQSRSEHTGPSRRADPDLPPPAPAPAPRRLGALGIPLSDSDDDVDDLEQPSASSSESHEAVAPVSPALPHVEPPDPTYSRGGSTRSGPSTRGEKPGESAAFVSEQNFRDIVDDLTLQNQQLRARLKRFESAKVPSHMKNERLFEVRFFQGLPKTRRREIESFLTDYVQTLSTSDSHRDSGDSLSSRAYAGGEDPSTSGRDLGDSISSIGRSLRSSEKEAMARATLRADAEAAKATGTESTKGSRGSGTGSGTGSRAGSGSGSGSGKGKRKVSHHGSGVPRYESTPKQEPLGAAPISTAVHVADPPSVLRRPADIFPPDRDVLAAPSFSGVEPLSTTGTGHEMRISDPTTKRRKRHRGEPAADSSRMSSDHRRGHSHKSTSIAGSTASDTDSLENSIVQMIECLFLESLPSPSEDGSSSPPHNPLQSEPYPLPAHSSSNTQYLRTILQSDDYKHHGGWLYLNLVSTMAALHRLAVSVSMIRHALRTKSELIEVSAEGSKIRWKGPMEKPSRKEMEAIDGEAEDVASVEQNRDETEAMDVEGRDGQTRSSASSEPATDSMFDDQPNRPSMNRELSSTVTPSTAATSLKPSTSKTGSTSKHGSDSKNGGTSSSGGTRSRNGRSSKLKDSAAGSENSDRIIAKLPKSAPLTNSALRHAVSEVGSPARQDQGETAEVLGSVPDAPRPHRLHYTPLFAQRGDSESEEEQEPPSSPVDDAHSEEDGDTFRLPKRRKGYEGGVVYFANDLFCSDLAGDFEVREKLKRAAEVASASSLALGESSPEPMDTDEVASRSDVAGSSLSSPRLATSKLSDSDSNGAMVEAPEDHDDGGALLEVIEGDVVSPEDQVVDAYLEAPRPPLRLSAMTSTVASDHFTIHLTYVYPSAKTACSTPTPASAPRQFPRPSLFTLATLFPPDFSPFLHCTVPRPAFVASKTLHHHPAMFVRPPRVLMSLSSDDSDTDSDSDAVSSARRRMREDLSPATTDRRRRRRLKKSVMRGHMYEGGGSGGDYLMSLALPLNRWAPVTKRDSPSEERLSSSRAGTGTGEPSESLITLD